ncbi:YheV family putative zinc ribbon protein [Alteromonas sp. ASW11-130]|uniref:YheV family putative zinc ribbon protein n=1 Tax=Alteromonas sp. ASW11-130 TaxID=3015775 RepID=UPI0022420271|nr:YheV family putative zinc ribbon protein [Alteromonas sp. ASW11-130]MCW8093297.1 YheV family putative metal-binding protein [Alteromonas sp. ASW11-130]
MSTKKRKRFIAGATCPKCQASDTVMLYLEHNVEKLECVACGYTESQAEKNVQNAAKAENSVIGIFKP